MEYKKWISNYNSKEYNEYLKYISIYNIYKNKILKNKKNTKDNSYSEDKNTLQVKYKDNELIIKKPVYKFIKTELDNCIEEKENLLLKYKILKNKILINDDKSVITDYKSIINKLTKIDNKITNIIEYYIKININIKNNIKENIKEKNELELKKKELYLNFLNTSSTIDKQIYIETYLDYIKKQNILADNDDYLIDYYIEELPKIIKKNDVLVDEVKIKKIKQKKKKNINDEINILNDKIKKELEKEINNTGIYNVKDEIEKNLFLEFIKLFNFENKQECSNKNKTDKGYMKKNEIIKIIKNNKKLLKLMPNNFENKKKKELCEILFNLK
jgi:hypothetical protein